MKAMIDVRNDGVHIKNCLVVSLTGKHKAALQIDPDSPHKLVLKDSITEGNYKKSILLRLYIWWNFRKVMAKY